MGAYTVNLDDDQFAAIIGRNCTTITFLLPPSSVQWATTGTYTQLRLPSGDVIMDARRQTLTYGADTVYAWVQGPADYPGLVEHPADVISHLAQREGLDLADVDTASVTAAAAAKTGYRVAFAYDRPGMATCDVLAEIARQAEMAIDWTQGTLRLVALTNDLAGATLAKTFADAGRAKDSHSTEGTGGRAVVTRMIGRYTDGRSKERRVAQSDTTAIASAGVLTESVDYWTFAHKNPVAASIAFWLYRLRYDPEMASVAGFLNYLDLLAGDIVSVGGRRGWITEVTARPGVKDADRIELSVAVPIDAWVDGAWVYPSPVYVDPGEPVCSASLSVNAYGATTSASAITAAMIPVHNGTGGTVAAGAVIKLGAYSETTGRYAVAQAAKASDTRLAVLCQTLSDAGDGWAWADNAPHVLNVSSSSGLSAGDRVGVNESGSYAAIPSPSGPYVVCGIPTTNTTQVMARFEPTGAAIPPLYIVTAVDGEAGTVTGKRVNESGAGVGDEETFLYLGA